MPINNQNFTIRFINLEFKEKFLKGVLVSSFQRQEFLSWFHRCAVADPVKNLVGNG